MLRQVIVEIEAPPGEAAAARVARSALASFLRRLGLREVRLSVRLCGDAAIRRLNARHRGHDEATDVLSFPAAEAPGRPRLLGDLVVSLPTARRRARALGVPFEDELRLYLAHGLLHLLGHDHHRSAEARRMARAERELLGARGLIARTVSDGPSPRAPARRSRRRSGRARP